VNTLQRVIENLLLVTAASRAMLQLARADGGFAIEAEAVQHAQRQIRHHELEAAVPDAKTIATLKRDQDVIVQPESEPHAAGSNPAAALSGTTRMLAPLIQDGRLVGVISLHHTLDSRPWGPQDKSALLDAQGRILGILTMASMESPAPEDLRAAATQAILDRVRTTLDVQRCTLRQPVEAAYAFPVTFESRAEGVRSLLGDFTIVQTGQPVIVKLLAERKQVVQEDCAAASTDPLFHKMLAHYGGMRAQMVTPIIVDDQLKGVLSIHELRHARAWTTTERALAAEAAALIGAIFETPPRG
jgi:GAF domain-containing protein